MISLLNALGGFRIIIIIIIIIFFLNCVTVPTKTTENAERGMMKLQLLFEGLPRKL